MPDEPAKKNGEKKVTKFFNLATFFFLSYKRNYLEIFMLPTLSPHSPSCTIGTGTPSRLFS